MTTILATVLMHSTALQKSSQLQLTILGFRVIFGLYFFQYDYNYPCTNAISLQIHTRVVNNLSFWASIHQNWGWLDEGTYKVWP